MARIRAILISLMGATITTTAGAALLAVAALGLVRAVVDERQAETLAALRSRLVTHREPLSTAVLRVSPTRAPAPRNADEPTRGNGPARRDTLASPKVGARGTE